MKIIEGVYISEIYSTLLQKNTLQLNKFLSQLDKEDWECLFEDNDENILQDVLEQYQNGTQVEYFIKNYPNVFICKVYKARFHDFNHNEIDYDYKTDYDDLFLFYKFSTNIESLIGQINEEVAEIMHEEILKENKYNR
jgi:hypothetical protein